MRSSAESQLSLARRQDLSDEHVAQAASHTLENPLTVVSPTHHNKSNPVFGIHGGKRLKKNQSSGVSKLNITHGQMSLTSGYVGDGSKRYSSKQGIREDLLPVLFSRKNMNHSMRPENELHRRSGTTKSKTSVGRPPVHGA